MPGLKGKDIPPGNWRRRVEPAAVQPDDEEDAPPPFVMGSSASSTVWYRRRPNRITNVRCRACGLRMHQILVDDGEQYHYLCNPEG